MTVHTVTGCEAYSLAMGFSAVLYDVYERRLMRGLDRDRLPRHVGTIVDGNRRWAKGARTDVDLAYQAGADKITEFLGWCDDLGIEFVTLWVLSTDNLRRPPEELDPLLRVIERLVDDLADGPHELRLIGNLQLLPADSAARMASAVANRTHESNLTVNVCVGYGGRQELADAMRSLLREEAAKGRSLDDIADSLQVDDIAGHLYTKGQPDPDLVIRTSGEQRLSGFLLWQSVHSEFYFADALWPAFRRVDFLRALRSYASRDRRFGA